MIDNKIVKRYILNSTNDLDEILNYLDKDFKATIEGIFNALFPLMKLYDQNKGRVDYLLGILEQLIEIKPTTDLVFLLGPITDLDNKISKLPLKDRIKLNEPYKRITTIVDTIEKKSMNAVNDSKLKYLEYLIFQNQNVNLIGNFIESHTNLLNKKNKDGADIIEEVLKKYLYLNEKEVDKINYYYHILLIFLGSNFQREVLKNRQKYYRLIKESKLGYKEHIIKVIELLEPNFQVELSEIEEKYNVNFNFHQAIYNELNNLTYNFEERKDYLYQDCITVDGDNSRCLDDALYIEKNADGTYNLYIHIVDIASLIPYNSVINEEARKRVKTLYLRNNEILLYPEQISHNLGSLLEAQSKNVISYIFKLDSNFKLIDEIPKIQLGMISVKHRLSYDQVDKIFKEQKNDELTIKINWLSRFAEERRKATIKKEKYRQYENMINMVLNHESLKVDCSVSANIIHESMILVNYSIAKHFKQLDYPYIYRKIVIPSSNYIEKQIEMIKQMDASIMEDKVFINNLRESAMESMYWDKPIYHSGLKLDCYSHSTSPARRYPDVFGQYLIHDLIIDKNLDNIPSWEYRTKELVRHLNKKEKENERFSSEYNYLSYKKLIKKK